jgi:hypothetical protein
MITASTPFLNTRHACQILKELKFFCCNNHNKHFTVTHNSHTFCFSTNSHLDMLLEERLYTLIISLQ